MTLWKSRYLEDGLFFLVFLIQLTGNKFVDDWIRTVDLWWRNWPLCWAITTDLDFEPTTLLISTVSCPLGLPNFLNWSIPGVFFLYFHLLKHIFKIQVIKNKTDDCIWTVDRWCQKRPPYPLRHNHCPLGLPEFFLVFEKQCFDFNLSFWHLDDAFWR